MLETTVDEKYFISDAMMDYFMGVNQKPSKFPRGERFLANINRKDQDRANSITTNAGQRPTDNFVKEPFVVASRGRNPQNPSDRTTGALTVQRLEPKFDGTTNTLTSVQKDNYVALPTKLQREVCNKAIKERLVQPNDAIEYTYSNARLGEIKEGFIKTQNKKDNTVMSTLKTNPQQIGVCVNVPVKTANKKGYDLATDGDGVDLAYPDSKTRRGRVGHGVSKTLPTSDSQGVLDGFRIRKLTPRECYRLMGFDDASFDRASKVISNTQLYKTAGNSIVVPVLEAILRELLCKVK